MTKALNELTSLADMGRFPWTVHLGASINIVFTIWVTHVVFMLATGELFLLPLFALCMVLLNLSPVVLLRYFEKNERPYPAVEKMNFFSDQHRFSTWVFAVAAGNMFFWITFAWCIFSLSNATSTLIVVQVFAFFMTFVPFLRGVYRIWR